MPTTVIPVPPIKQYRTWVDDFPNPMWASATEYKGACSCGWRGRWYRKQSIQAKDDADDHYERRHAKTRMPCSWCGVWTCAECGWKRQRANYQRPDLQNCARCGSSDGEMRPSMHSPETYYDHYNEDSK